MEISCFMDFINTYDIYAIFLILVLCGLGLPLPEDITLITAGVVIYHNQSPSLFIMVLVCLTGVILGDFIAFMIGYLSGEKLLNNKYTKRIITETNYNKINNFYLKYGSLFIFIGRFLPGLRMPIFLFAGIFKKVKPNIFVLIDFLASIISVPVWVYIGYYFGGDLKKIKEFAMENTETFFILSGITFVAYVLFIFIKNMRKIKIEN